MPDKLNLKDATIPLRDRYDKFLIWLLSKNHAVVEFMAQELELTVSEVDVFNKLGELSEEEFDTIDSIKFDIGLLFIVVRAPKEVRNIMYERYEEILKSPQPLANLKSIVDEHSNYTSIEEFVKRVSGSCWMSIASYLRQRGLENGTINKGIRGMLVQVANKINKGGEMSVPQLEWIVRAIQHDHASAFGVFTNDTIRENFNEDYQIFLRIHEHFLKYAKN